MIDGSLDGRALEDGGQDGGNGVKGDIDHDHAGETAEPNDIGEDTAVEEDDGDLGAVDGGLVEDLRDIEGLFQDISI